MIDFVWQNLVPYVEGGVIVGLWFAARDRRKAVDRLVRVIEHYHPPEIESWRAGLKTSVKRRGDCTPGVGYKAHWDDAGHFMIEQDAPDRVIARSVRRMTKK